MTLWPRQVEILTAMCEGRDYHFPGATALDRAKRKYAALNKLRALGYVSGSEITLKGRLVLSAHLANPVERLAAMAGSHRELAEVLNVRPETVSRMHGVVPENYHADLILWGQLEGVENEVRDILRR